MRNLGHIASRRGVVRSIDLRGIHGDGPVPASLSVYADSHRIWSTKVSAEAARSAGVDGAWLVTWPNDLLPRLRGSAQIAVSIAGEPAFDELVRFDDGDEPPKLTDRWGRRVSLDKSQRIVSTFDGCTPEQRRAFLVGTKAVLDDLEREGVAPFLAYGSLLGAVRDFDFLPHDNDADVGYISRFDHPADVAAESFRLERALLERGYTVERYSGGAFRVDVDEGDGAMRGCDVFAGFFRNGTLALLGEIFLPIPESTILPRTTVSIHGIDFPAPADVDAMLAITYGPTWRVPDPGFKFTTPYSTTSRFDGWFRGLRHGRDIWERAWRQASPRPGAVVPMSDLMTTAIERHTPDSVVDLGCGRGWDAFAVAAHGRPAVGLDLFTRCTNAMRKRAERDGVAVRYDTINLLDLRSIYSSALTMADLPGRRLITARHVYDGLNSVGKTHLLRLSRMLARGGSGDGVLVLQVLEGNPRGLRFDRHARNRPWSVPVRGGGLARRVEKLGGTATRIGNRPLTGEDWDGLRLDTADWDTSAREGLAVSTWEVSW